MALKAGTVGVNPDYVDKNDAPIASSFKAGDKKLTFTYDQENDKIGYKDEEGTFYPFDGAGGAGWVRPANLTTEGTVANACTIVSGGYAKIDGMLYVDMLVLTNDTTSSSRSVLILNTTTGYIPYMARNTTNSLEAFNDYQINATSNTSNEGTAYQINITSSRNHYEHIFGVAKLST